jgi:hypothetical protein
LAVGRFQVMALLQAARAHVLGLPIDSAYSWGLNRAIFYAAAKRGFKGGEHRSSGERAGYQAPDTYRLGDEMAYKAPGSELLFTIGGKTQGKEEFKRQIESRFQGKFKEAWEEAVDYVEHFDRGTLLSGEEFFSSVYRPKRDELAAKWTEMSGAQEDPKRVKVSRSSRRPPSGQTRSS